MCFTGKKKGQTLRARKTKLLGLSQSNLMPKTDQERTIRQLMYQTPLVSILQFQCITAVTVCLSFPQSRAELIFLGGRMVCAG